MAFEAAKNLVKDLKRKGFESYLVGGVVRDFLMKRPFSDIDITTKAKPYEILKLYKSVPTGLKYGTVTILFDNHKFEVTTFRLDGPSSDFRHPDSVIYSDNVLDDVNRRDFTMNGILMDEFQNIYDHVSGIKDIKDKIIRTIGNPDERFNEDALRILRAVYFQSKLGFKIHEDTLSSMKRNNHLLKELKMERVLTEMIKILKGPFLKDALTTLINCELHNYLPGLKKGIEYVQTLDEMPYVDTFFALSFTLNDGIIPSTWPFSNIHKNKYKKASYLAINHPEITDHILYQYGLEISILANKVNFYLKKAPHLERKITSEFKNLPVKSIVDLALTSDEIVEFYHKKPGAWLGKLQRQLVIDILDKKIKNTKEDIIKYLERSEKL
ncbi:MAG: CCA tRNA nucleotidyltransferase [Acholeplasmataceae bacterium]